MTVKNPDGKEIGNLVVEIMEDSDRKPTNNYWLTFVPKVSQTYPACADVITDEYSELDFADGEKVWNYSKPIIGIGKNGQPVTIDSWGEKK